MRAAPVSRVAKDSGIRTSDDAVLAAWAQYRLSIHDRRTTLFRYAVPRAGNRICPFTPSARGLVPCQGDSLAAVTHCRCARHNLPPGRGCIAIPNHCLTHGKPPVRSSRATSKRRPSFCSYPAPSRRDSARPRYDRSGGDGTIGERLKRGVTGGLPLQALGPGSRQMGGRDRGLRVASLRTLATDLWWHCAS